MIGYWLRFGERERERGSFEIGRPRSTRGMRGRGERGNIGRRWRSGVRGLENWTIFIDVICVSSLIGFNSGFC